MLQVYKCRLFAKIDGECHLCLESWDRIEDDAEFDERDIRWVNLDGVDNSRDEALTWDEVESWLSGYLAKGVSFGKTLFGKQYVSFDCVGGQQRVYHGSGTKLAVGILYTKVDYVRLRTLLNFPTDQVIQYVKDRWYDQDDLASGDNKVPLIGEERIRDLKIRTATSVADAIEALRKDDTQC